MDKYSSTKKAISEYRNSDFQIPGFAISSHKNIQPGLHVRRINGKELTDDEMREHYASLAAKYGGRITGRYTLRCELIDP